MSQTLREWFDEFEQATSERPHSIVFAQFDDYYQSRIAEWALPAGLQLLSDVAAEVLDKEFSDSYGANESPDFCAWSENWVLFPDNYDGAESICWVPRNPIAHKPIRPGGG